VASLCSQAWRRLPSAAAGSLCVITPLGYGVRLGLSHGGRINPPDGIELV
jgi:hypothetical protein